MDKFREPTNPHHTEFSFAPHLNLLATNGTEAQKAPINQNRVAPHLTNLEVIYSIVYGKALAKSNL